MSDLLRRLPVRVVSDEMKHDDDLGMDYRALKLELPDGRGVRVSQNQEGYVRAKCGDEVTGSLDEGGFYSWLMRLLDKK